MSHIRITVEHAYGRLKGHFRALQNLPGRDIEEMLQSIEALLILHNILLEFGDAGEDMEWSDPNKEREDEELDENLDEDDIRRRMTSRLNDEKVYQAGIHRRKLLVDYASENLII